MATAQTNESIAKQTNYSVEQVQATSNLIEKLRNAPEFKWYDIYATSWMPTLSQDEIRVHTDLMNSLKVDSKITEKFYQALVQQALDPNTRDLYWKKDAVIRPEMTAIRKEWRRLLGKIMSEIGTDYGINVPSVVFGDVFRMRACSRCTNCTSCHSNLTNTMSYLLSSIGILDRVKQFHGLKGTWDKSTTAFFAMHGCLDCLIFAHEQGYPWDEKTCELAAREGKLDCLKYAHENGCPWNEYIFELATSSGHLECMKYVYEQDPTLIKDCRTWACSTAALNGHLDCLKFLREHGAPWDEHTCRNAASRGHLDCLRFLRESNPASPCPWNEEACEEAVRSGHLKCLKYLHESVPPCPWDAAKYIKYGNIFDAKCVAYVREQIAKEASL